jgi:O-succinylbenzoic acid--CoA ligase
MNRIFSTAYWESSESDLLLNPHMPLDEQNLLTERVKNAGELPRHLWLATSGTTSTFKLIALAKEAFLCSAQAVNNHLEVKSHDVWLNALPEFHVGGLSIWARAYLSKSKVVKFKEKWNPFIYCQMIETEKVSLSSLVPTQVFDLVKQQIKAPSSLRAIVVGGGMLDAPLYQAALALGWPLLPSYGMTECASQIATAKTESPELCILPHMEIKIDADSRICIKSPALLTYCLSETGVFDPKVNGWLTTQDCGKIQGNHLKILGRVDDFIKVGGELVSLMRLEEIFTSLKLKIGVHIDSVLIAFPDPRLGYQIHLAAVAPIESLVNQFNSLVLPFEQIKKVHIIKSLPRSSLGKVLRKKLVSSLIQN